MMCLGLKPRAEEWKVQTNPLSYGGTPVSTLLLIKYVARVVVYSHNNTHYTLAIDWLQFAKIFHNILNNFLEKNHLIKILYYLMQESSNHFFICFIILLRIMRYIFRPTRASKSEYESGCNHRALYKQREPKH